MFPLRRDPTSPEISKKIQFKKCLSRVWQSSKGTFEMGQTKPLARATQKADTAYAGDVSRLLDICRERIVFEKLQDLTDCLEAVRCDEELIIVRIKSSMTKPGLKPVINSGLGFISINVRIDNCQTRKLAIHTHVCELQLMLKGFAETMSRSSHKDYIQARNTSSVFQFRWSPLHNTVYDTYKLFKSCMQKMNVIAPEDTGISVSSRRVSLSRSQNPSFTTSRRGSKGFSVETLGPKPECLDLPSSPIASPINALGNSPAAPVNSPAIVKPIPGPSTLWGTQDVKESGGAEDEVIDNFTDQIVGVGVEGGGGGGVAEEQCKWKTSWKVELEEADVVQLECICRLSAMGLNEHIDNNLSNLILTKGIGKAMATNIVFTTKRLLFTMSSVAQFFLALVGIVCVVLGLRQTQVFSDIRKPSYRHFKFVSLSDHRGKSNPSTPGVADFGIQHKNLGTCIDVHQIENMPALAPKQYSDVAMKRFEDGNTIMVSFDREVPMIGWFIRTNDGGSLNTSNFVIHGSNFDGAGRWDSTEADPAVPDSEWVELARPGWIHSQSSWISNRNFNGKLDYDKNTMIFFEPVMFSDVALTDIRQTISPFFMYGMCLLNFALFGFLKMPQHGTKVMVFFLVLLVYASVLPIPMVSAHEQAQAFFAISKPAVLMMMAFKNPQSLVFVSLMSCALLSLCQVVYYSAIRLSFGPQFLNMGVPWLGLVIMVYMISMEFAKRMTRIWGNYIVKGDMERYDLLWKAEVEKDTGQLTLKHLSEVVKMLGLDESSFDSRKRNKQTIFRQTNRKFLYLDGSHLKHIKKTDVAPSFTR